MSTPRHTKAGTARIPAGTVDFPPPRKMMLPSTLRTIAFALIVTGGFLSYTDPDASPAKAIGYGTSFLGLILAFVIVRKSRLHVSAAFTFCFLLFITTAFGLIREAHSAESYASIAQALSYPIVAFLLLAAGHGAIAFDTAIIRHVIAVLAAANMAVALLSIVGGASEVPFFGDIESGRYIFGTTIHSSSGLMSNANYFATTQASLFFLFAILTIYAKGRFDRKDRFILLLIGASSILGSSRGTTLAMACGLASVLASASRKGSIIRKLCLLSIAGGIIAIPLYFHDAFYSIFRLSKGLNMRDDIWSVAIDAWLERPLFGWGINTGWVMGTFSAGDLESTSTHSGYLQLLVRGGIVSFLLVYGFLLSAVYTGMRSRKDALVKHRWSLASVVFYLVASGFRTYSFGGLGLLPLLAGIAVSIIFHAPLYQDRCRTSRGFAQTPHPGAG